LGGTLSSPANEIKTPLYEYRFPHSEDGIGKFYQGREISHVMGHQAAEWLERPEREAEEQASQMIAQLKLRPGMTVADVGAGTGYYARRIAELVKPSGRVLAVDIQPEMLQLLTNTASKLGLTNITPVLGSISNANLAAATVDLALLVDVYHEFDHPYEMMSSIVSALKPGGRLVLVEFRGEDPKVPIKELHKMSEAQVRKEMGGHALRFVENITILPRQHLLVFERLAGAKSQKRGKDEDKKSAVPKNRALK
jgi:ubiquinone/menaquinone biosynthesis C-methylase UbiE